MKIRLLLAPLAAGLGLAPPHDLEATADTEATRLDASGHPLPDDASAPVVDAQPMPEPGAFAVSDGAGGMIYGFRIPAGLAPKSIEELKEDGQGNVTGRVLTFDLPLSADGQAAVGIVKENSAGGVTFASFQNEPGK